MAKMTDSNSFLIAECKRVLFQQLAKVEKNKFSLNIPKEEDYITTKKYPHFHLFPEVFFQIEGFTKMSFPSEKITLAPGSITIVPRSLPHFETAKSFKKPFSNIVVAFRQNAVSFHLAEELNGKPHMTLFEIYKTPLTSRVKEYLEGIIDAHRSSETTGKIIRKGILCGYLGTLLNILEGESKSWKKEHSKVTRCKQLIMSSLSDNSLNVKKLSEWIKCSPDYLSYLFHKETKVKLVDYINMERIQNAQFLLDTTDSKVAAVGWASGYHDPGYFIRIFKKTTGKTPNEYRH